MNQNKENRSKLNEKNTGEDIEQNYIEAFKELEEKQATFIHLSAQYSVTDFKTILNNISDVTMIGLNTSNLINIRQDTPDILLSNIPNLNNYPMLIEIGKLKSSIENISSKRNTHNISYNFVENLPQVLENADVIYYHANHNSYNPICYDNGNPIVISIKPNEKDMYNIVKIDTNKVSTLFDVNSNIDVYFEKTIAKVIYSNITKKEVISRITGNVTSKLNTTSLLNIPNK